MTFGGAFSNHISAVAALGKSHNLKTIGIIRGDELGIDLEKTLANNTTLKFAHDCGMQFKFVSRSDYREKTSSLFINKLKRLGFPTFFCAVNIGRALIELIAYAVETYVSVSFVFNAVIDQINVSETTKSRLPAVYI